MGNFSKTLSELLFGLRDTPGIIKRKFFILIIPYRKGTNKNLGMV